MLEDELLDYLRDFLPGYMVPSAVVLLAELPQTPNHKVDVGALPEVPATGGVAAEEGQDELERELARFWAGLVRRDSVGPGDNLFRVGGNSLLVMRLIAHVSKQYHVAVPAQSVFENPTVAALAHRIRASDSGGER